MSLFGATVDPDLAAVVAAGTANGVLSLLAGHAELRLALGTPDIFLVRLGFRKIAKAHVLKGIGLSGSSEQTQERFILAAAALDIAREHAIEREDKHSPR